MSFGKPIETPERFHEAFLARLLNHGDSISRVCGRLLLTQTLALAMLCGAGCRELDPGTAARIRAKADQAKAGVEEWQRAGRDPSELVRLVSLLKQVRPMMEAGRVQEAEAALDDVLTIIVGVRGSAAVAASSNLFGNPQRVDIRGYDGDAMEPFITRDGRYLLFNNSNDPRANTDLHWAHRIDAATFEYVGPIQGVNTEWLEGVPSLDHHGNLVFVSTRSYDTTYSTLYLGHFEAGVVSAIRILPGTVSRRQASWVNMDAELSGDGQTLYVVSSQFDPGSSVPKSADIQLAMRRGDEFVLAEDSDRLLAAINTAELEYAPAISEDGRELFFTRATGIIVGRAAVGAALRIYVATRQAPGQPFGAPQLLDAISGYVEAPTITADGSMLYFHKKEGDRFVIYKAEREPMRAARRKRQDRLFARSPQPAARSF